jgi:Mn2+/Fe2+ NRAMP family transporter
MGEPMTKLPWPRGTAGAAMAQNVKMEATMTKLPWPPTAMTQNLPKMTTIVRRMATAAVTVPAQATTTYVGGISFYDRLTKTEKMLAFAIPIVSLILILTLLITLYCCCRKCKGRKARPRDVEMPALPVQEPTGGRVFREVNDAPLQRPPAAAPPSPLKK